MPATGIAFIKHGSNDLILSSTKVGEEDLFQKKKILKRQE